MSNWKDYIKQIEGKEEEIKEVVFTYLEDKEFIKDISTSCGCINYVLEGMFLKIQIKLPKKAPQVDAHVFETNKFIYVTYQNNTQDTLQITAKVYEKNV